jgi:hypothetical protein
MTGMPGVGAMTDTLDFVKKMWGGMNIPGMAMPSLSVNDINKQITDLKAVESWLTLNMNMLRGTIQALEVQSATIATLQSMGESMSAMVQPPVSQGGYHQASQPAPPPQPARTYEPSFSFAPPTAEKPPAPKSDFESEPAHANDKSKGGAGVDDAAALAAPFANPAVWWNMLQDQFKQAVNTAAVPEPEPVKRRPAAAAKPKAAPTKRKSKAAPKKAKP